MIDYKALEQRYEQYGSEYLLRQLVCLLTEECTELAQACLHLIRVQRREGHSDVFQVRLGLAQELANCTLMIDCVKKIICTDDKRDDIDFTVDAKANRMVNRLIGGEWND